MAYIDIMATQYKFDKLSKNGFDSSLGYWFWNMAVMIAPMDTGNLRSAIMLSKNKSRHIRISYNTFMANYIRFLEEGQGPVKKYKDFIKGDTREAIVEQLVSWIISGKAPSYAKQGVKPFVQLGISRNKPFSQERALLRQANMNTSTLTAKTRQQISKIREASFNQKRARSSGERVQTQIQAGLSSKSLNRNTSKLEAIYKDRIKQIS